MRSARALVSPALVAVGILLPLVPGLLPDRTLAWRDSALLHAPFRSYIVETIRHGRLPLWDPWEGAGQPILAQAFHLVLNPVALAVASFSDSIDVLLVALLVTAALGAWVAARTLGATAAEAAVAAFAYGLSGYVLGMTTNALYLGGAATLPWTVAGLRQAADSPTGWIAAAGGTAAAGLTGDPGSLAAGIAIGLALAAERGGGRALLRAAGGAALGIGAAAIQLVPTMAYLPWAFRGAVDVAVNGPEQWSLDLARLPELVSPGLFVGLPRSYSSPVFAAFASRSEVPFPWTPSIFVGAPVAILAALGMRGRSGRVLVALAAFFLWVSLGRALGATQLLGGLPVWGSLRYWEKMVAPLALCLALAAALGVRDWAGGGGRRLPILSAGVALALGSAAALAWVVPGIPGGAGETYRSRLSVGLAYAAACMVALAVGAIRARRYPPRGAAILAAVVFAQSGLAAPFALHYGRLQSLRLRPPAVEAPEPGPRLVTPVVRNFEKGAGDGDAIDRTHAFEFRLGHPAANVAARVSNAGTYTGFGSVRHAVVAGSGPLKWELFRRLGATHVVAPDPEDEDDRKVLRMALGQDPGAPHREPDGIQAWSVKHRPWASFASSARAERDLRKAANALGDEIVAGRDTVVVESESAPPLAPGRVLGVSRRPEEIAVDAESEGPALLVVNDAFAPGWVAEIDGAPVPVLAADVLVRAVRWPTGRHRLVMRYDPPEVALGAAVSAAAVAVALVALLLQRRRRGLA
jgi:hypothetical protein